MICVLSSHLMKKMLHEVFSKYKRVITVEDGCLPGGFGSAILEFMADHGYQSKIIRLGMPDRIVEHGEQDELYKECGYDADAIKEAALKIMDPQAVLQ